MLFTILTCLYITCFSWLWGAFILQNLKKTFDEKEYPVLHFSIVCLIGLAGITVVAAFFSLFIPLGGWEAQLLVIIPGLVFLLQKKEFPLLRQIQNQLKGFHIILVYLLVICCLLALIMASWKVNHPDTLYYHAQTIQWIEKYKAIPGLVHLHVRYGYQGLWFVSSAIFGFRFTGIESVTTLNFSILIWFFFFLARNIHVSFFEKKNIRPALLWMALLIISFWDYTQARLTATSASPDFIAALYIWLIFYLLLNKQFPQKSTTHRVAISFLCLFAVTIKLSAFPILIVAGFICWQIFSLKKIKPLLIACLFSIITLIPFIARNITATGYVIFPSPFPDVTNVDWKFNKESTVLEKDYITAYAKGIRDGTRKEIQESGRQNIRQWLPSWWKLLSLADKFLMILLILSIVGLATKAKSILKSGSNTKIAMLCTIAGIVFWFIQAPDPRFGFGFIIALPALTASKWLPSISISENLSRRLLLSLTLITSISISVYFVYRTIYYFSPKQLIQPIGIQNISYHTFQCNGVEFKVPENGNPCGDIDIPCTYTNCETFEPRGKSITDGFRAK